MELTAKHVQFAESHDDSWGLGNQVLCDLCRMYPRHDVDAEIVAKVWLIGRAYSASIERGRGKAAGVGLSNDQFYTVAVPNALRKSRLDGNLEVLAKLPEGEESTIGLVLHAHADLVRTFLRLTNKRKRSLASKYLHFHLPHLFFIYDSRAMSAIRALRIPGSDILVPRGVDKAYADFVSAAIGVQEHVHSRFGQRLNPRQLDRLLLATFASRVV
jgi:hypothetical protein